MYTPEFSKPRVLSVSQLNFYIKSIIENDARLNFVFVTGEISNLTDHYRSGHIYLSIKDEKSVIRAVMFAGNARNLKFRPTERNESNLPWQSCSLGTHRSVSALY